MMAEDSMIDMLGDIVAKAKKEYCSKCGIRLDKSAKEFKEGKYCPDCAKARKVKK
jgi:hypothetical protein